MPEKVPVPPHSKEAEQSALGAALMSADALADVMDILREEDFYDAAHREIFSVMRELYSDDKNVDIVTVSEALKRKGSLEAAGGRAYIADLPVKTPLTINAAGYAEIVSEKSDLRALISAADKIKGSCYDEDISAGSILDRAEQSIFDIAQKKQKTDYSPLREVLEENLELIDRAAKNEGELIGLNTGFRRLNEITNGLQKSNLIVLAARPGVGKSAFALNIAKNAAEKANASVLIFNLEMSKPELGMRLLAMESSIKMDSIISGKVTGPEWHHISTAVDSLASTKIVIDDKPGISLLEMKNKCRRLKKEQGLDLVIVDYLQLMSVEGRAENRNQEIGKLTRGFKLLARELDCPVMLLSQLRRSADKNDDKKPMPSDLRDSGSIEQDADVIIFLYRDEANNNTCHVDIAKHRNGPTDDFSLTFIGEYSRFAEIDKMQD